MAVSISCDLCGETIGDESSVFRYGVELRTSGAGVAGNIGQYHNTAERPCWDEMLDRIRMIHEVSADLGFKPKPVPVPQASYERDPMWERHGERKRKWEKAMSVGEREDTLLKVLGDDALTGAEIADLINDGLGVDKAVGDITVVHLADIRRLVQRLVNDGRLHAATELPQPPPLPVCPKHRGARGGGVMPPTLTLHQPITAWTAEATQAATNITQKAVRHACPMSTPRNICPPPRDLRAGHVLAGQKVTKSELSYALHSPNWRKIVIVINGTKGRLMSLVVLSESLHDRVVLLAGRLECHGPFRRRPVLSCPLPEVDRVGELDRLELCRLEDDPGLSRVVSRGSVGPDTRHEHMFAKEGD